MLFLNFGLPVHPTEVLYLDEDTCSDLVNQFGRNMERLRTLHVEQISKVLRGAKKGGHIRWHILATDQGEISSNFRDGCLNTYYVSVGFEEPGLGVVPNVLDETKLRKLVQALGVDLDEIRKLMRDQVVWVLKWLREAGMVECFEVEQNQVPIKVKPSEPSGNHNTDFSQYTSPSVVPSLLTSDRTLSSPVNFPPHAGDEIDLMLKQCMASPGLLDTIDTPFSEPVTTTMGSAMSPEPDTGALYYPTPPHFVSSPPAGRPLVLPNSGGGLPLYQSINTRLSVGSSYPILPATPVGLVASSGSNANALSYPTASTCYVDSPPADESLAPLSSGTSSQTKFQLLQLCRFGKDGKELLEESRIPPILKAEAGLLRQDPLRLLQPFLHRSQSDALPSLNALGLPVKWMDKEGAVNYYRVLEAEKQNKLVLDPLAKRFAQILFYLNYRWLVKHVKQIRTSVATFILNACPEEPNMPELMKSRRDNITGYHVRRGKWCWMLAACLGAGILVCAGDAIDAITNSTFTNDQLNVFISFVLQTRPGSVRLLHLLEPVVKAFMLGTAAVDLRPIILAGNTAITRQEELACAYAADEAALADQQTEETWLVKDAESIAEEKIAEFLPDF